MKAYNRPEMEIKVFDTEHIVTESSANGLETIGSGNSATPVYTNKITYDKLW